METLLIHNKIYTTPHFNTLITFLKEKGVALHPGPRLASLLPIQPVEVSSLRQEYGGLECSIEVVGSLEEAIEVINAHGSAHTDTIITEDGEEVDDILYIIIRVGPIPGGTQI